MEIRFDKELDIRGLVCPFTYIKTKIFLDGDVKSGEVVKIITDHEPAFRDVPRSVSEDGHSVLGTEALGKDYIIYIKKK